MKKRILSGFLAMLLLMSSTLSVFATEVTDNYSAYDSVVNEPDKTLTTLKSVDAASNPIDSLLVQKHDGELEKATYANLEKDDPNVQEYATSNLSNTNLKHIGSPNLRAYQQVKAGNYNGSMSYEAMAGVPTTEELYTTFGGSQYLVDLDYRIMNADYTRTYDFNADAYNYLYFKTVSRRENWVEDDDSESVTSTKPGIDFPSYKFDKADRFIQYHYVTRPEHIMSEDPETYTRGNAALVNFAKSSDKDGNPITDLSDWTKATYNNGFKGEFSSDDPDALKNGALAVGVSEAICFKNAAYNAVDELANTLYSMDDNYRKDQDSYGGKESMYTYGGIVRLTKKAYGKDGSGVTLPDKFEDKVPFLMQPFFCSYLYDKDGFAESDDESTTTKLDTFGEYLATRDDLSETAKTDYILTAFNNLSTGENMYSKNYDDNQKAASADYYESSNADATGAGSTFTLADANLNELRIAACFGGSVNNDGSINKHYSEDQLNSVLDWTCHDYVNNSDMHIDGNSIKGLDGNNQFNYNEIANVYTKDMYSILLYLDSLFYSGEPCLCEGLPGHIHSKDDKTAEGRAFNAQRDACVKALLQATFQSHTLAENGDKFDNEGSYNFSLTIPLAILPPGGDLDATSYVAQNDTKEYDVNTLYNQIMANPDYVYGVDFKVQCDYGFDYSDYYESVDNNYYYKSSYGASSVEALPKRVIDGKEYQAGRVYNVDFNVTDPWHSHMVTPTNEADYYPMTEVRYAEYYPISSFSFVSAHNPMSYPGDERTEYIGGFSRYIVESEEENSNLDVKYNKYNATVDQVFHNVQWLDLVGYRIYHVSKGESDGLGELLVDKDNIYGTGTVSIPDDVNETEAYEIVSQALNQKGYVVYDINDNDSTETTMVSNSLDKNGRLANSFYPGSKGFTPANLVSYRLNSAYDFIEDLPDPSEGGATNVSKPVEFMFAYRKSDVPELDIGEYINKDPQAFKLTTVGDTDSGDILHFKYDPMRQGGRSHTSFYGFINQALAHSLLYVDFPDNYGSNKGYYEKSDRNGGTVTSYKNALLIQGDFMLKGVVSSYEETNNVDGINSLLKADNGLNMICGSEYDTWSNTSDKNVFNILSNENITKLSNYLSCDSWIPARFERTFSRNSYRPSKSSNTLLTNINDVLMLETHSDDMNNSTHSEYDQIDPATGCTNSRTCGASSDLGDVRANHYTSIPISGEFHIYINDGESYVQSGVNDVNCLSVEEVDVPKVGYLGNTLGTALIIGNNGHTSDGNSYNFTRENLFVGYIPCIGDITLNTPTGKAGFTDFERLHHGTSDDVVYGDDTGSRYTEFFDIKGDLSNTQKGHFTTDTDTDSKASVMLSKWYPFLQKLNTSRYLNNQEWYTGSGKLYFSCLSNPQGMYTCKNTAYKSGDSSVYSGVQSAKPYLYTTYQDADYNSSQLRPNSIVIFNPSATETSVVVPLSDYRWDEHNMSVSDNSTYMGDSSQGGDNIIKRNQVSMSRSNEIITYTNNSEKYVSGDQIWQGTKNGSSRTVYVMKECSDYNTDAYNLSDYTTTSTEEVSESYAELSDTSSFTCSEDGTYTIVFSGSDDKWMKASVNLKSGDIVTYSSDAVYVTHALPEMSIKYADIVKAYLSSKGYALENAPADLLESIKTIGIPINAGSSLTFGFNGNTWLRKGDYFYFDLPIVDVSGNPISLKAQTTSGKDIPCEVLDNGNTRYLYSTSTDGSIGSVKFTNNSVSGSDNTCYLLMSAYASNPDAEIPISTECKQLLMSLPVMSSQGVQCKYVKGPNSVEIFEDDCSIVIDSGVYYGNNYYIVGNVEISDPNGVTPSEGCTSSTENELLSGFNNLDPAVAALLSNTIPGIVKTDSVTKYTTSLKPDSLANPHKVPSTMWAYYVFGWKCNGKVITVDNWGDYFDYNGQLTNNNSNATLTPPDNSNLGLTIATMDNLAQKGYLAVVCVDGVYYLTIHDPNSTFTTNYSTLNITNAVGNNVLSDEIYLVFNNTVVRGDADTICFGTDSNITNEFLEYKDSDPTHYASGTYPIKFKASKLDSVTAPAYNVQYSKNPAHKTFGDERDYDKKLVDSYDVSSTRVSNSPVNPTNVSLDDEFTIYWDNVTDLIHKDAEVLSNDVADLNDVQAALGKGWEDGTECNSGGYLSTDDAGTDYVNYKSDAKTFDYNNIAQTAVKDNFIYGNTSACRLTDTTKWLADKYVVFNIDMYGFISADTSVTLGAGEYLQLDDYGDVVTCKNDSVIASRDAIPFNPTVSAFTVNDNGTFTQNIPVLIPAGTRVHLGYQIAGMSSIESDEGSFVDYGKEDETKSSTKIPYTYHFYCPLSDGETDTESTVMFGTETINSAHTTEVAFNEKWVYDIDSVNGIIDEADNFYESNLAHTLSTSATNIYYPLYRGADVDGSGADVYPAAVNDDDRYRKDEWGYNWLSGVFSVDMLNNIDAKKLVVSTDGSIAKHQAGHLSWENKDNGYNRLSSSIATDSFAIIGSIGGLTVLDSGDPRWQDTFKHSDDSDTGGDDFAIAPIVHKVSKYHADKDESGNKAGTQKFVLGDISDVRGRLGKYDLVEEDSTLSSKNLEAFSLDTYNAKSFKTLEYDNAEDSNIFEDLFNTLPDKDYRITLSDKLNYSITPISEVNNIHNEGNANNVLLNGLANSEKAQIDCVRLGYLTYCSLDTIGNYYGSLAKRSDSDAETPTNNNGDYGQTKIQIRPVYYYVKGDEVIPVDVYMRSGNEYRLINIGLDQGEDYKSDINVFDVANNSYYSYSITTNNKNVDYTTYQSQGSIAEKESNFVQEILRYSITDTERLRTLKSYLDARTLTDSSKSTTKKFGKGVTTSVLHPYGNDGEQLEGAMATNEYTYGSSQLMFLREYNRTFMGGSTVALKRGDEEMSKVILNANKYGQSWYFNIGLPESAIFVKHGSVLNSTTMNELLEQGGYIVTFLDVYAIGEKYVLHYDSGLRNQYEHIVPNDSVDWKHWYTDESRKYLIPVNYYDLEDLRSVADRNTRGSH